MLRTTIPRRFASHAGATAEPPLASWLGGFVVGIPSGLVVASTVEKYWHRPAALKKWLPWS